MGGEGPILETQSGHLVNSIGRNENSTINCGLTIVSFCNLVIYVGYLSMKSVV